MMFDRGRCLFAVQYGIEAILTQIFLEKTERIFPVYVGYYPEEL
jgi:hypothetical protein